jgi:hypothetical protein
MLRTGVGAVNSRKRRLLQQRQLLVPAGGDGIHALRPQRLGEFPREAVDGENFLRLHLLHQLQQAIVVSVITQRKRRRPCPSDSGNWNPSPSR